MLCPRMIVEYYSTSAAAWALEQAPAAWAPALEQALAAWEPAQEPAPERARASAPAPAAWGHDPPGATSTGMPGSPFGGGAYGPSGMSPDYSAAVVGRRVAAAGLLVAAAAPLLLHFV
ncbi:hypothetical protein ZWY2020_005652 [Hordeum vulgare]|nr:hypothetical protein ZWY2020_005652 [Hordeum vulgare]